MCRVVAVEELSTPGRQVTAAGRRITATAMDTRPPFTHYLSHPPQRAVTCRGTVRCVPRR